MRRVDGRIRRRQADTRRPDSARVRLRSGGRGARARSPTVREAVRRRVRRDRRRR